MHRVQCNFLVASERPTGTTPRVSRRGDQVALDVRRVEPDTDWRVLLASGQGEVPWKNMFVIVILRDDYYNKGWLTVILVTQFSKKNLPPIHDTRYYFLCTLIRSLGKENVSGEKCPKTSVGSRVARICRLGRT